MNGFDCSGNDVKVWIGSPNDQAAHDSLLQWLTGHVASFITAAQFDDRVKGNLGETISFCVGIWHDFSAHRPFPANAMNPLSRISSPDVDIVWIRFGSDEKDDVAVLQEVKTTGDPSLSIAPTLLVDYDKLFGTNVALTVHTRLQAICNEFQYVLNMPQMCARVLALAGVSPATSPKARLLPTLVHERLGAMPVPKLSSVRTTLLGRGWPPANVAAWSVGLDCLNDRLLRLAIGSA
jgi:hypothetical protein